MRESILGDGIGDVYVYVGMGGFFVVGCEKMVVEISWNAHQRGLNDIYVG